MIENRKAPFFSYSFTLLDTLLVPFYKFTTCTGDTGLSRLQTT